MVNFFKQAPTRETEQKRFLEAITRRQNVIASFPLNYAPVTLYAFSAMMGAGLVVVVCPSSRHIRRNLDYFKGAGYKFPEVAYLDGTQMPHEERTIQKEVNYNRVRLLYVTPERFASLTFLEMLVHADVSFMVIEEAERFLPTMPGHGLYKQLQQDGFNQLLKLPPMALVVPPLPPIRLRELSECLQLPSYQMIQLSPLIEPISIQVRMLMTEHQKFEYLVETLSGNPEPGKQGRLDKTGSVLIQAAYPAQAEKLGASLLDYGFESVWITHFKKSSKEQAHVLDVVASRLDTVVVNAGSDMRHWSPPYEAAPRMVFWSPPASVDDLFLQVFRQTANMQTGYAEPHFMKGLVLYTKEDFQAAVKRLQANRHLDDEELRERMRALKHFRKWVLSESCRLQTLAAYYQGSSTIEIPPCGQCDRCRQQKYAQRFGRRTFHQFMQRWFY
jgi:superfamily II DNA helicase RecQ